jgi:hypothetical protein
MRPSLPLALSLLALPGTQARAVKSFLNRSGQDLELRLTQLEAGPGGVQAIVVPVGSSPSREARKDASVHHLSGHEAQAARPIQVPHGSFLILQPHPESHGAPVRASFDLYTLRQFHRHGATPVPENMRLKYVGGCGGEALEGVQLLPEGEVVEEMDYRYRFRPSDRVRSSDLDLVKAPDRLCVML